MKKAFIRTFVCLALASAAIIFMACIVDTGPLDGIEGAAVLYEPGKDASGMYPVEIVKSYLDQGLPFYLASGKGFEHKKNWTFAYWQGDDGKKYQAGQDLSSLTDKLVLTAIWVESQTDIPENIRGNWTDGYTGGSWEITATTIKNQLFPFLGTALPVYAIGPIIVFTAEDFGAHTLGLLELVNEHTVTIRFNDYDYLSGPFEENGLEIPPLMATITR